MEHHDERMEIIRQLESLRVWLVDIGENDAAGDIHKVKVRLGMYRGGVITPNEARLLNDGV